MLNKKLHTQQIIFISLCLMTIHFAICAPPKHSVASENKGEVAQIEQQVHDEDVRVLVEEAIDMAQNLSMIISPKALVGRGDAAEIVPFSLFPSPFPRSLFEQAKQLQTAFNLLYFRISNDYDFLVETYKDVAVSNEQIRMLLQILQKTHEEGIKQTKSIILARSDYMCHETKNNETNELQHELKQIEFNAGQIGGMSVSSRLVQIHRHTMKSAKLEVSDSNLPFGAGDTGTAEVLFKAWEAFGDQNGIIVLMTHRRNRNRFSQRHIEYEIRRLSKDRVPIVRIGYPECTEMMLNGRLTLDPNDFKLLFDKRTVSVFYFATDFWRPTEENWALRLMIERSTAIKSPSVGIQMASQKKMQQVLAKPGIIERFLPELENAKKVASIRQTFAGLWNLTDEDEETLKAAKDAISNPSNYVLKPSKEGGGNNIWDDEIANKLLAFTSEERSAYILMQKLQPMLFENYMVRPHHDNALYGQMSTELSIFGFLLGDSNGNRLIHNKQNGHMLRTKLADVNEGGVVHGTAVFDMPFLF